MGKHQQDDPFPRGLRFRSLLVLDPRSPATPLPIASPRGDRVCSFQAKPPSAWHRYPGGNASAPVCRLPNPTGLIAPQTFERQGLATKEPHQLIPGFSRHGAQQITRGWPAKRSTRCGYSEQARGAVARLFANLALNVILVAGG